MSERKRVRVLVADDEEVIRMLLQRRLAKEGIEVVTVANGVEAVAALEESFFNAVLTDLKMPEADGMHVLHRAKEINPDTEVIIMTAYASTDTAIEAVRAGAYDYLTKPFEHVDEVVHKLKRALSHQRLVFQNREMLAKLEELNKGLRQVVVARTRELNRVQEDLKTVRRAGGLEDVTESLQEKLGKGLDMIATLAKVVEREGDETIQGVAALVRREATDLMELLQAALSPADQALSQDSGS